MSAAAQVRDAAGFGTARALAALAIIFACAVLLWWSVAAERRRRRQARESTQRRYIERAEQMEGEYASALQRVVEGGPLSEILRAVTEASARLHPRVRACVLVADAEEGTIAEAFAAELPESFAAGIRGAPVAGHAPSRLAEVCGAHGILGWHAIPVIGASERVLGWFVLGFVQRREVTAWERRIARFGATVAAIAIERDRTASAGDAIEAHLRLILDSSRDFAVITLDPDGIITGWNKGAESLLGYSEEEAVGLDGRIIFTPEDLASGEAAWELQTALRDGQAENERWHQRKDGSRFWGSGLVLRVGEVGVPPRGLVKVMRDRSEARFAEIAVRHSEQRFRSLVSVIADVSWTSDPEGRFVREQHAWEAYTGQTFEQHRDYGWLHALHPDDRDRIATAGHAGCRAATPFHTSGRMWHAATEEFRWFETRAVPVLEEDGSIREWVGACSDVHERKQAEQALLEASRRKDEFLAVLAHELRNPLAPIRLGLELLQSDGADAPSRSRVLPMMHRQVDHLVRLVDDLLEVSRITRGLIELRKEPVDVVDVVQNAVEMAGPAIEASGHRLALRLPATPVVVEADSVRIAQVVGNLLANAAKFTDPGGTISVEIARTNGQAVISVSDTGVGISEEKLRHVFEPFTQLDRTLDRSKGGLGIGLALAANLVRLHGGTVEARSQGVGRGSEFLVTLPLLKEAGQPATRAVAPSPSPPAASGPVGPVVVIDDNRDAADSLAMLIELKGCRARTVYDGESGLDAIRSLHPQVVFLDLGMPGMDGYAVAAEVRRDPELHDVKLVALTGWGADEDRRRSQDAGFDYHLVKPVDAETLETVLTTLARAS